MIAVIGTLAVTAYAGLGILQILWLNPLAAAPGMSLDQISGELEAAQESLGAPRVIVGMGLGPVIAVLILVGAARGKAMTTWVTSVSYLTMLSLGALVYAAASFGAGMALADTFFIGGQDRSPWSTLLYLTSVFAFIALIVVAIAGAVVNQKIETSAPATQHG